MSSLWIFLFLVTLNTISKSYVKCLQTSDKKSFGPKAKGTIKTIEALGVGDIIDCVGIYEQPAFENPLTKDLKMAPSSHPSAFNKKNDHQPKLLQTWNKYGECPNGTIPIRRTLTNNHIFHQKTPNDDPNSREYATTLQYFKKGNGGKAMFNVWNPLVASADEFSLSQMWVVSGAGTHLNTVEAGWMVYPHLFHDAETRLFTFWTRDNYNRTGCYNLVCPAFVQINEHIALGAALEPVSVYNGRSVSLPISLSRSREGDWWLEVHEEILGYFPHQLFTTLGDGANSIQFGGEIVNPKVKRRHTSTAMGSGHFPHEGYRKASFVSNIKVKNENFEWVEPPHLQAHIVTRPECYDLMFGPPGTELGNHFYFGGPGLSRSCV